MRQPFLLAGGTSAHVFDGTLLQDKSQCVVYRICVEAFGGAELKILSGEFSRMLTPRDHVSAVDVAVRKQLYLQALGSGEVSGYYMAVLAVS